MARANETRNSDADGVGNSGSPESALPRSSMPELDLHFWSRLAVWTLQEAAALCLGLEFKPGTASFLERDERFLKKMQLLSRASQAGLLPDPVSPPEFISWAQRTKVMFPAELGLAVLDRSDNWVDWKVVAQRAGESFEFYKQQAQQKENTIRELQNELCMLKRGRRSQKPDLAAMHPKSFTSLLKLVGGMAVAVYNFNPAESRSDVASQIQSDLDIKGINLDLDTIRKWIRESSRYLSNG